MCVTRDAGLKSLPLRPGSTGLRCVPPLASLTDIAVSNRLVGVVAATGVVTARVRLGMVMLVILASWWVMGARSASALTITTSGCQSVTVPAGVSSVSIIATGSAGASGQAAPPQNSSGGDGDVVSGTLSGFSTGQQLLVCVNVGGGAAGTGDPNTGAGGGGGASGVALGSVFSAPVLVAAGGGGGSYGEPGGAAGNPSGAAGGCGCTDEGDDGGGGTLSMGGTGGSSDGANRSQFTAVGPGSGGVGGSSASDTPGGGGGGGYFGGGGGGATTDAGFFGGGGGGGADYCASSLTGGSLSGCGVTGQNSTADSASVTLTYTYPLPTASISSPAAGGVYHLNQVVSTSFSCTDSAGAPGIASCDDSNGTDTLTGGSGRLNTSNSGQRTYTVTALSGDAERTTAQITYTVIAPPASTGRPTITAIIPSGRLVAGDRLVCSMGSWANSPTSFSYQWNRNGTPIVDAGSATYKVASNDEGNVLTCTVTASNESGAARATSSFGVRVPVPKVAKCPAATGSISGARLGSVKLGETRAKAQHAYRHSADRRRPYEDFFCLTPVGISVGYASPKLLAGSSSRRLRGTVVWIATASAHYAIEGIRPGATLAAANARLKLGQPFAISGRDWYIAPLSGVVAILELRNGIVQEVGIGSQQVAHGRAAQLAFVKAFS